MDLIKHSVTVGVKTATNHNLLASIRKEFATSKSGKKKKKLESLVSVSKFLLDTLQKLRESVQKQRNILGCLKIQELTQEKRSSYLSRFLSKMFNF